MALIKRDPGQSSGGVQAGPGTYAQAQGGRVASFDQLYEQIRQENQQARQQEKPEREMSALDKFFAAGNEMAESIQNFGGFQEKFNEKQENLAEDPVGTIASFVPTLPLGILGAIPRGGAAAYEAITGRPATEGDLSTGKMSGDDLTLLQRAGAAGNAAVELGGTFAGGSARLLGSMGNAAKKAMPGAEKALDAIMPAGGKGLIRKAGLEVGDSKLFAGAKQFGFDVAEEAGEEFAQSYFDDMRNETLGEDSLSRAATAAGWGALGGGIMAGAGAAINAVVGDQASGAAAQQGGQHQDGATDPEKVRAMFDERLIPSVMEYRNEKLFSSSTKEPGAFGTVVVPGHMGLGLNDTEIGTEDFKSMVRAQGESAHQLWADKLGTTKEEIVALIDDPRADKRLNELIAGKDGGVQVNLMRNPGTSKSSKFRVNLTKFNPGYGMRLNSMTAQLSGGDVDGDTRMLMDDDFKYDMPSRLLTNRLSRDTSTFNFEYMPYLDTDQAENAVRDSVYRIIISQMDDYNKAKHLSNEIAKHARTAYKDKGNAFGKSLFVAWTAIRDRKGKDVADDMVANMVTKIQTSVTQKEVMQSVIDKSLSGASDDLFTSVRKIIDADPSNFRYDEGSVGKIKDMAALCSYLDMVYGRTGAVKSLWFRQTAALKLEHGKRFPMLTEIVNAMGGLDTSAIDNRIATWMRLIDQGEHVQESIAGEFNAYVEVAFANELDIGSETDRLGLGSKLTVDQMTEAFQKAYNEAVSNYNKAIEKAPYKGAEITVGAIPRNPINFEKNRAEAMEAMLKVIGTANVTDYIAVSEDSMFFDLSFDQAADIIWQYGSNSAYFQNLGTSVQNFMSDLGQASGSKLNRLGNVLMDTYNEIPRMSLDSVLDPAHYNEAMYILDAFVRTISPEVGLYASIGKVSDAINKGYGKIVFEGTASERANLALALSLQYTYREVIESIADYKEKGDEKYLQLARQQANALRNGSNLNEAIAAEIESKGESRIIDVMCKLDYTYEQKSDWFIEKQGQNFVPKEPLLVSAVCTDMSMIGVSGVSQRITRASGSVRLAKRTSYQANMDVVRNLRSWLDSSEVSDATRQAFVDLMYEYALNEALQPNRTILSGLMGDARVFSLSSAEKGSVVDSASMMYQQIERARMGGPVSLSQNLTGWRFGTMSIEEFCNNRLALIEVLFNNGSVNVYGDNGLPVKVNLETILRDVTGKDPKLVNGRMETHHLFALLEACPAIVSTLAPSMMSPTVSREDGGGISQSAAMVNTSRLDSGFKDWVLEHSTSISDMKLRQEKRRFEWDLLSRPEYYELLGYAIDENSEDSFVDEVEKRHAQLLDFFYNAKGYSDYDLDIFRHSVLDQIKESGLESLRDMMLETEKLVKKIGSSSFDTSKVIQSDSAIGYFMSMDGLLAKYLDDDMMLKLTEELADLREKVVEGSKDQTLNAMVEMSEKLANGYKRAFSNFLGDQEDISMVQQGIVAMFGRDSISRIFRQQMFNALGIDEMELAVRNEIQPIVDEFTKTVTDMVDFFMTQESTYVYQSDYSINKGFVNTADFEQKVRRILSGKYFSNNEGTADDFIKRMTNELLKAKTDLERADIVERYRWRINSVVMNSHLRNVESYSGPGVNLDTLNDANNMAARVEKMIDEQSCDDSLKVTQSREGRPKMPKLHIGNSWNSAIATNALFYASTGQIGTNVGVNGSILNKFYGFASLPHDRSCSAPPSSKTMPFKELAASPCLYIGQRVEVVTRDRDGNEKSHNLVVSSTMSRNLYPEDAEVRFHDGNCLCGYCRKHSAAAGNGSDTGYIDINEIITTLLDYSQEDLNLKLKKSLEATDRIVGKRRSESDVTIGMVDLSDPANLEAVWDDVYKSVIAGENSLQARVAMSYNQVFNEEKIDGLGYDEAARLAALTCSVVKVTMEDGTVKFCHLDKLSQQDLRNEMLGGHGPVASVEQMVMSIDQINRKIMHDIARHVDDTGRRDRREIQDVAFNALTNWDTGAEPISMRAMLNLMPTYAQGGPGKMLPADSPTALQRLHDIERSRSIDRFVKRKPLARINDRDKIDGYRSATRKALKITDPETPIPYTITKVVSSSASDYKYRSNEAFKGLVEQSADNSGVKSSDDYAAILIADDNMARKALSDLSSEAMRYDYILVPTSAFPQSKPYGSSLVYVCGQEFYQVNKIAVENDLYYSDEKVRYGMRKIANENIAVFYGDDTGILGFPDSGIVGNPEFLRNFKFTVDDPIEIDVSSILNDNAPITIASKKDLMGLKEKIENGDAEIQPPKMEKLHRDNAQAIADNLIQSIPSSISDWNERGFRTTSVGMHQIFGFAKQVTASGKEIYVPLFVHGSHPRVIDEIEKVEVVGGKIKATNHTKVSFDDYDYRKLAFPDEAYKGIVRWDFGLADPSSPMPKPPKFLGDFDRVFAYDAKSQKGRLFGRGSQVLKNNCYFASKLITCSARYVETPGGWIRNPNLNPNLTDAQIDSLFDHTKNNSLWTKIALNEETLFRDVPANKMLNNAIAKLARGAAVNGNGLVMATLLEPFDFGKGNSLAKMAEEGRTSFDMDTGKMIPLVHDQILGILKTLDDNETLALFNGISGKICPPSANIIEQGNNTMVNAFGQILAGEFGGRAVYMQGRIGEFTTPNVAGEVGEGIGSAARGKQHIFKHALEYGLRDEDMDDFMSGLMSEMGYAGDFAKGGRLAKRDAEDVFDQITSRTSVPADLDLVGSMFGDNFARSVLDKQIAKVGKTYSRLCVSVTKGSGEHREVFSSIPEIAKIPEFVQARDVLEKALNGRISVELMMNLVKSYVGWSYNDNVGNSEISIETVNEAASHIARNVKDGHCGYIIKGQLANNKVSMALLPKAVAEELWSASKTVRDKYGTRDKFRECMMAEQVNSKAAVKDIRTASKGAAANNQDKKINALKILYMYIDSTYGRKPAPEETMMVDIRDLRAALDGVFRAMLPDADQAVIKEWLDQKEAAIRQAQKSALRVNGKRQYKVDSENAELGYVLRVKNSDRNIYEKIGGGLESLNRIMTVANLFLAPANAIESAGHTAILKAGLNLPVGPYSGKRSMEQGTVAKIAGDDRLLKFYKAYKEAALLGMDEELILGFSNAEDKDQFISDLYSGRTKLERLSDRLFKFTSAEELFLKSQLELTIARFDQLCNADNIIEQILQTESGQTLMETQLLEDPVQWMTSVLSFDSASRMAWMRAANFAEGAAMARENVVSLLTRELFEKVPAVSFMSSTMFTPFYRYVTNYSGRVLNWFMPLSSMNYVLVEQLKGIPSLQDIGIERAQIHQNLQAAIIADAMHMTIPVLAMIIAIGLTGALQPPEDEDKIIDYREWTFFGMRVNAEWWMQDCLGPALPLACFVKTGMDGNPRLDVLMQGLGTVLQNNPLMSVSDIVNVLAEPDMFATGMQDEAERYKWAPGGEPTASEQLLAKSYQFGLNFLGRFITPSFLKEWQRDTVQYEKSYKRVFVAGSDQVNAEAGQTGETERVPYTDAMIRQATRRNPVLGWLMDLVAHPTTSYSALGSIFAPQGMPNVEYDDPVQRYIQNRYSVNYQDENGEYVPKSDAEKQQVFLDVVATLEAYDDMEELRSKGFMIDWDTRMYVSDQIWQIINQSETDFFTWYNSAEADPTELGGGDYWSGREIRNEAYQAQNDFKAYWESFYYDKLWSNEMKQGVQKYFRKSTDYRQDANGDWYASGFPSATSLTGAKVAPGTLEDPQGTMGYSGDWGTPSAVTGTNTWERALVPVNEDLPDTPNLDEWAEIHSDLVAAAEKAKDSDNNGNGSPGGGGYPYGGYGYRRGGGGGGGGYSPNLYSRPSNISANSPRVSSSGNLGDTRFDYLRPGFETKGSREAMRRTDF